MYSDEDLDSAIKAGVLSGEAVTAFRAHVAQRSGDTAVDDEHFRLVTGFNDIFVVIGCALLLTSVAAIAAVVVAPWFAAMAVAGAAWGLAEYFTRRRRMALPSIVLLLVFVGGVFAVGPLLFDKVGGSLIAGGMLAAIAAAAHWWRFHVPITVAAGAAAVVGGVLAWLAAVAPDAKGWITALAFVAGAAVFALAMRWDASDRMRRTRRSDVAFWLHILAAPLMVRAAFGALGIADGSVDAVQAFAVLVLYGAIALVSLAIDRRALMVSALGYVLFTFSDLLRQFGLAGLNFAITALAIGAALLLLSAFWHASRAFVLRHVPLALQARLAPYK